MFLATRHLAECHLVDICSNSNSVQTIISLCITKESWDHSKAFMIEDAGVKERLKY
jgi:hypothetical protein